MKFVCISDTHGSHWELDIPRGDIFIHAGDFTNVGKLQEVIDFNKWLGTLHHKHKIIIAGNHELGFQKENAIFRALITNAIYLQDSLVIVEGIKIYGSPWQPEFMDWAFNLPRGNALKDKWTMIPDGIDILVTHGPPKGFGDYVKNDWNPKGNHLGCADLLDRVAVIKPKHHVFGHIHAGYGNFTDNGIEFHNASIMDESYEVKNKPIEFYYC